MESRVKRTPNLRYRLIRKVIEKYQFQRMVSVLCEAAGVSRSGYYRYWSHSAIHRRMQKEQRDEEISLHVRRAFQLKKRNKGARSIKMTLEGQYQIVWNLKRIPTDK